MGTSPATLTSTLSTTLTGTDEGRGSRIGIRGTLIVLIVVAVLPVIAFAAALVIYFAAQEERSTVRLGLGMAQALAEDVDREVATLRSALLVLSTSSHLANDDLASFQRQIADVSRLIGQHIALISPDGTLLVSSRVPQTPVSVVVADPAVLEQTVKTRQPQVSNLYRSPATGRPSIRVQIPLLDGDRVKYVLDVNSDVGQLAPILARQKLPKDWIAVVFDSKGMILARSEAADRLVGTSANPDLVKRFTAQEEGWFRGAGADGIARYTAFRRLKEAGWTAAVGIPHELIDGPVRQSVLMVAGGGIALLALGIVLAALLARRIDRGTRALLEGAGAAQRGEPFQRGQFGVQELDDMGLALQRMATLLRGRTESLERDVEERTQQLLTETEERKRVEENLVRAQKMEAIGQLTGGIAHDFNNLLTAIAGNLELIEQRIGADERLQRYVGNAQRAADRASTLCRDLLAFARRHPLRRERCDLQENLRSLRDLLDRSLRGDISIVTNADGDLWPVEIDPGQFELAILNIAVNARDAMPEGGTITVTATNGVFEESTAPLAPDGRPISGEFVEVTVSDTGRGIDPAHLSRVFEPFFTTKARGKGTGLGLSQVYGFVQQSKGAIALDSRLGQGTTLRIYLPRLASEVAPLPAPPNPLRRPSTENTVVLLVAAAADPAAIAAVEIAGNAIIRTTATDSAIQIVSSAQRLDGAVIDLADISSTIRLVRDLRRIRPTLAIVVVLDEDDADGTVAVLRLPRGDGTRTLTRPYTARNLVATIDAALASAALDA